MRALFCSSVCTLSRKRGEHHLLPTVRERPPANQFELRRRPPLHLLVHPIVAWGSPATFASTVRARVSLD